MNGRFARKYRDGQEALGEEFVRCSTGGCAVKEPIVRVSVQLDSGDLLHALLGHYARQLGDVQDIRIALANRLGAMERDGLAEEWRAPISHIVTEVQTIEKAVAKELTSLMKHHPLKPFIEAAPGIGLPGVARLLGIVGSLDRFATVQKLWAYLGLHVVDGRAPRRRRGETANWNQAGRKHCYVLSECIVKVGRGKYRQAYDRKKVDYLARQRTGPSNCPFGQTHLNKDKKPIECGLGHAHNAAMRYAIKIFLRDLWSEWQRLIRKSGCLELHPVHESPKCLSERHLDEKKSGLTKQRI